MVKVNGLYLACYYTAIYFIYKIEYNCDSGIQLILDISVGKSYALQSQSVFLLILNLLSILPFIVSIIMENEKYAAMKRYLCLRMDRERIFYKNFISNIIIVTKGMVIKILIDLFILLMCESITRESLKTLTIVEFFYFLFFVGLCSAINLISILLSIAKYESLVGSMCYAMIAQRIGNSNDVFSACFSPIPDIQNLMGEKIVFVRIILIFVIIGLNVVIVKTKGIREDVI